MAFEMNNSPRGVPRGRGGRGRGFGGDRGGGFGGRGGVSRGFRGGRGGDRGGRGSFRGGDRGRGFGGPPRGFRGAPRGGRGPIDKINGSSEETPVCHEIAHGLQLRICYKSDIPSEDELKQMPGFHSRFTKSTDAKAHFLLFKDIESLEAARKQLDEDDTIDSVDYMGLKSARNQTAAKESRQLFLNFSTPQEEETVKKLDSKILSVESLKDKTSWLAEYATSEEANSALKTLLDAKDRGDLRIARESHALKLNNFAQTTIQPKLVVIRDVPKKATLKDLAPLFPDATSLTIYNQTFPSSEYCHASLRFEDQDRVKEILSSSKIQKVLGKKIFVFPAYSCLLNEMPKLGEAWTGDQKNVAKSSDDKPSPSKKIKLESNDVSEDEDEEEGGEGEEEEEEDDDDEEEGDEEGDDQNMESEEDGEEEAEEEGSDDE